MPLPADFVDALRAIVGEAHVRTDAASMEDLERGAKKIIEHLRSVDSKATA